MYEVVSYKTKTRKKKNTEITRTNLLKDKMPFSCRNGFINRKL